MLALAPEAAAAAVAEWPWEVRLPSPRAEGRVPGEFLNLASPSTPHRLLKNLAALRDGPCAELVLGSWLSVCLATGLGPAHRKRRLGEAARAGRLPSTEQGAGLGWTEGASSGGRTGTGKGRFGPSPADPHPTLAVSFSQEDAKLPRGCAYSRVREGRGGPRGPDRTSVCLDKSPAPRDREGGGWASAGICTNSDHRP